MAYEFKLPDLGEGIHEGEIKRWYVKEGDTVKADQTIADLETDKAVVEMPSPKSGVVLKIFGNAGEKIKVGQVLIVIGQPGESYSASTPSKPVSVTSTPSITSPPKPPIIAPTPAIASPKIEPMKHEIKSEITPITTVTTPPGHVIATPFVRKLARELGIDLEMIIGSGEGGRITENDVKRAASEPPMQKSSPQTQTTAVVSSTITEASIKKIPIVIEGEVERVAFKGVRKTIAEHMITSMKTAMHVTSMDEADVTELSNIRDREKVSAAQKGIKLTYLAFVVKALIAALKEFPYFNSSLDEEKAEVILKKYYNIGIAVDTAEGLIVPVVKNADRKTILEIAKEISEFAEKARARKLTLEEMRGGSFTITNIGSLGGVFATPIINYPEVAILGIYKIEDRPVVRDGIIVIRRIMNFSITFDHRVIDGAETARFGNTIKKHLEDPGLLMVDE